MDRLQTRDYIELFLLSAIWGASFLFLRIAAPVFGPVFLIEMRVFSALVVLLPVFIYMGKHKELTQNWKLIFLISLTNMSIPFCLLAFATLTISAGLASILNATVPFFTAIIAFIFFSQRLPMLGVAGLLVGFAGVVVLVFDPSASSNASGDLLAIGAGLLGSLLYGTAINITAYKLKGVSGIAITVGSLLSSTLLLLPFALWQLPEEMPSGPIWLAVIALGVLCTGIAYLLFYRLIARVGSSQAVTTTYLIPLFSILWGNVFLAEGITLVMLFGCMLVLVGVAMTTGRVPAFINPPDSGRSAG